MNKNNIKKNKINYFHNTDIIDSIDEFNNKNRLLKTTYLITPDREFKFIKEYNSKGETVRIIEFRKDTDEIALL
ncbi:MAG: hypothetical protein ACN23H_02280 [Candidatus Phytoplasma vitis]|nr:MAG: hypothetical protein M6G77_01095 [Candidatus Phytoplasma vitis]